jgi:hypothetical protein
MKRLLATAGATAVLLTTVLASPALAYGYPMGPYATSTQCYTVQKQYINGGYPIVRHCYYEGGRWFFVYNTV